MSHLTRRPTRRPTHRPTHRPTRRPTHQRCVRPHANNANSTHSLTHSILKLLKSSTTMLFLFLFLFALLTEHATSTTIHDNGECHSVLLTSPPPNSTNSTNTTQQPRQTTAYGIVFAIENNGTADITLSSFSVHLDTTSTTSRVNFTLYALDGMYIERDGNGGIVGTRVGEDLNGTNDTDGGWYEIASGVIDTRADSEGSRLLPFSSFASGGSGVTLPSATTKSFYLSMPSKVLITYEYGDDVQGEILDDNVILSDGYDGVNVYTGRGVIFHPWVQLQQINGGQLFNQLYSPQRFLGKLWTPSSACPPTSSPTTPLPTLPPLPTSTPSSIPSITPSMVPSAVPTMAPSQMEMIFIRNSSFDIFIGDPHSQKKRMGWNVVQHPQHPTVPVVSISQDGIGRNDGSLRQLRLLQVGTLCFDTNKIYPLFETLIAEHAMRIYDLNPMNSIQVKHVDISIVNHTDISHLSSPPGAPGDCTAIRIFFDQKLVVSIKNNEEINTLELAQLPFATESNQQLFLETVVVSDSFFEDASGVGDVVVRDTSGYMTTKSPTGQPSLSSSPTGLVSSTPSRLPSSVPSTSVAPSSTVPPSSIPSTVPTTSTKPSIQPSTTPSILTYTPSSSHSPSTPPSLQPTTLPSSPPSHPPSTSPTTYFTHLIVFFQFDIWYPPIREEEVMDDIVGNVTASFEGMFEDSRSVLYGLVRQFELGISEMVEARVDKIVVPADELACTQEEGDDPNSNFNYANVCERFLLRMPFQHNRIQSDGYIRFWLLQVSDQIAGNLTATYSGDRSIMSYQIMVFRNATGMPGDEGEFCLGIFDTVNASLSVLNITVLEVNCTNFGFEPYNATSGSSGGNGGGLRRMQTEEVSARGNLNVEYSVAAEYRPIPGEVDEIGEHFGELVEDSINADNGDAIKRSLEKRNVDVVSGATVETLETTEPTLSTSDDSDESASAGTPSSSVALESPDHSTKSTSGTTGIAVVVSCFVVGVVMSVFLFRRGIRRNKESEISKSGKKNVRFADESDLEGSNHIAAEVAVIHNVHEFWDDESTQSSAPDPSNRDDVNIFGETLSPALSNGKPEETETMGELLDTYGKDNEDESSLLIQEVTINPNESSRTIDRVLRKSTSSDSFMERLRARVEKEGSELHQSQVPRGRSTSPQNSRLDLETTRRQARSESPSTNLNKSINSFEARLRAKVAASDKKGRLQPERARSESPPGRETNGLNQSINSFEARLLTKISESKSKNDRLPIQNEPKQSQQMSGALVSSSQSDSNAQMQAFEERIRKKSSGASTRSHETALQKQGDLGRNGEDEQAPCNDTSARIDSFHDKIRKKNAETQKTQAVSRSTSPPSLRSKNSKESLENFDSRLQRKLSSSLNQGVVSQEKSDVLASSCSDSNARLDAFEQRVRRKNRGAAANPKTKDPSDSLSSLDQPGEITKTSTPSGQADVESQLDSFHEKIQRKSVQDEKNRSRSLSPTVSQSSSSKQSLNNFEAKLQRKLSSSVNEGNVSQGQPSVLESSRSDSKAQLDAFEERIRKKNAAVVTKSTQVSNHKDSLLSQTDGKSQIDSFHENIRRKSDEDEKNRPRSLSPTVIQSSPSRQSLNNFEAKLQSKLSSSSNEGKVSHEQRSVLESSRSNSKAQLDAFEERIRKKNAAAVTKSTQVSNHKDSLLSQTDVESQLDSFYEKIRTKSDEDEKNRSRSLSPTAIHSSSLKQSLNNFEAKLQRKLSGSRNEGNVPQGHPGVLESSRSDSKAQLDAFEERIRKKNAAAVTKSTRVSNQKDSLSSQTDVKSQIDSFHEKIRRKSDEHEKNSPTSIQSSSSSIEAKDSMSSFEAKLQSKPSNNTNGGNVSQEQPSVLESSRSNSKAQLDAFEERIRKKNAAALTKTNQVSPLLPSSSNVGREAGKEKALSTQTSSQLGQTDLKSQLDSFHERIRRKTDEEETSLSRSLSPSSHQSSSSKKSKESLTSFEARLQRKLSNSLREGVVPQGEQRMVASSRSDSNVSLDKFEARIRMKNRGVATDPKNGVPAESLSYTDQSDQTEFGNEKSNTQTKKAPPLGQTDVKSQLDSFHERIRRKGEEDGKNRSLSSPPAAMKSSSASIEETKLQTKLSSSMNVGNAPQRNQSVLESGRSSSKAQLDAFEERIRKKNAAAVSKGNKVSPFPPSFSNQEKEKSLSTQTSPQLGVTSVNFKIRSFHERIRRKTDEEEKSLSRSLSPSSHQSSSSSKKSKESLENFEARLQRKLSRSMNKVVVSKEEQSVMASSRSDSSSRLDAFEARIRRKNASSDTKNNPMQQDPLSSLNEKKQKTDNGARVDQIKKSIQKPSEVEYLSTSQSSLQAQERTELASSRSDSNARLDAFEARIRRKNAAADTKNNPMLYQKLTAGDEAKGDQAINSTPRLSRQSSRSLSPTSRQSTSLPKDSPGEFEARLQKKLSNSLNEGVVSRGERSELSSSRSDSNSRLNAFEERIRRKNAASDTKKNPMPPESLCALNQIERKKNNLTAEDEASGDKLVTSTQKSSQLGSRSSSPASRQLSKESLDNFAARLQKKMSNSLNEGTVSKGELTMASSRSDSNARLDAFESRIRRKNAAANTKAN